MNESKYRVLIVDDETSMSEVVAEGLTERGYDAISVASSEQAARLLEADRFDALITDLRMPNVDGLGLLEVSRRVAPDRPVIIMTAFSAVDSAIESIRRGAYHYLTKPFQVEELALFLGRALAEAKLRRDAGTLRRVFRDRFGLDQLLGESDAMRGVRDLVVRLADTTVPVLIVGETGTGKGVVARAIHAQGDRASAPFVTVNCAALPENLLESELFGHVKGAFTGATAHRVGLYEEASGGTIFLDEIGEMPLSLQVKLLDVLERGVIRSVGSNKERRVDARVLAATHRDLRARVAAGAFREDLLYRLEVVTVELPPLRHRPSDIPVFLAHFLEQARTRHPKSPVRGLSKEATEQVLAHTWPGNLRELEHLAQRLVLLGRDAEVTLAELLSMLGARSQTSTPTSTPGEDQFGALSQGGAVLPLREMQRRYVAWALQKLGGRKLLTAETLGIDDKTLAKWLSQP